MCVVFSSRKKDTKPVAKPRVTIQRRSQMPEGEEEEEALPFIPEKSAKQKIMVGPQQPSGNTDQMIRVKTGTVPNSHLLPHSLQRRRWQNFLHLLMLSNFVKARQYEILFHNIGKHFAEKVPPLPKSCYFWTCEKNSCWVCLKSLLSSRLPSFLILY